MKDFERVVRICRTQLGLCTWNQLIAADLSRRQVGYAVTTGLLVRVQPGVYALGGMPDTAERALLAACLASGAYGSHRSASRLWGLPTPGPARPEVVALSEHLPRLRGVTVHRTARLDRVDRTVRAGIPTTALARTVLDLGAVLRPWEVELAMEDAVLRLGTSIHALRDCVGRMGASGRAGSGVLRAILDWRDPGMAGPDGALNGAIQRLLRRHRLPPWVCEHWVTDGVRLDFAWPEVKLGIEGDSRRWHAGRFDVERNTRKHNALVRLGWTIYRYTWVDVRYRPAVIADDVGGFLATRRTA